MPAHAKPKDKRQRRNKPTNIVPMSPRIIPKPEAPPCPKGLLKVVQVQWKRYWDSGLAETTDADTDLPAITRLFTLYDERERAYRFFKKNRLIQGSQGQVVLNPMGRHMNVLDAEIRQMEDRLGLTPKARLQLGITLGEAARSLDLLNQQLSEEDFDEEEDPR